jgi:hypothetical protein
MISQNPVLLVKEDTAVRPHQLRNNTKHTESVLRVQSTQSDIETQSGEVYCHLSLLGIWCVRAVLKGPAIAQPMHEFAFVFKY